MASITRSPPGAAPVTRQPAADPPSSASRRTVVASAMVEVTERSMPPVIMTTVWPIATASSGSTLENTLARLAAEAKPGHHRQQHQEIGHAEYQHEVLGVRCAPPARSCLRDVGAPHPRRHLLQVVAVDHEARVHDGRGTCLPAFRSITACTVAAVSK